MVLNYSYIISNVYTVPALFTECYLANMLTLCDIGVNVSTCCQYVWYMVLIRAKKTNTLNTRTLGYDYNYKNT